MDAAVTQHRIMTTYWGAESLEKLCERRSIQTVKQLQDELFLHFSSFPQELRQPFQSLLSGHVIPILYYPGWLDKERGWCREYIAMYIHHHHYKQYEELLFQHHETFGANIVDAEWENITRKTELYTGVEFDSGRRQPLLILDDTIIDGKWYAFKYYDTSALQKIGADASSSILKNYIFMNCWDLQPRVSRQLLLLLENTARILYKDAPHTEEKETTP